MSCKVGVVYNPNTGIVLRTIITSNAAEEALMVNGWPHLQPGEAIEVVERSACGTKPIVENVCAAVKAKSNKDLKRAPRCAVIDATGTVCSVVQADPELYVPDCDCDMEARIASMKAVRPDFDHTPQGPYTLKECKLSDVGDRWENGELIKLPDDPRATPE